MQRLISATLVCFALGVTACRRSEPAQSSANNTSVNARDVGNDTLTAQDQSNTQADRMLTQQIRQALVGDELLSMNARNVKIITVNGVVTLRGPVNSEAERVRVTAATTEVAGPGKVNDQLDVVN